MIRTVEPTQTTTLGGARAWLWVSVDDSGRELEVIAVNVEPHDAEPYLLVIHVMPTRLKG